jgi:hypothetical protein
MSLLMIISGIGILRPSFANTESSWSLLTVFCHSQLLIPIPIPIDVFSNLQNCPITINYVVDMGSASGAPGLKNFTTLILFLLWISVFDYYDDFIM